MSWDSHLIGFQELMPYVVEPLGNITSFPLYPDAINDYLKALFRQQTETWPMLREAISALDKVEYKEFSVAGSKVRAQFNPGRLISTAAKVDAATISQRPCFLCVENLPPEEKGLSFGNDLTILCNPFPVLPNHLVIASNEHTPQQLTKNRLSDMLDLADDLAGEWFVLYNGARCGASAPDHFHFQACYSDGVPLFEDFDAWLRRAPDSKKINFVVNRNYRFKLMACGSSDRDRLMDWVYRAIELLAVVTNAESEPMFNLIVTARHRQWSAFILPRSKHRPACYDAEGDAKLTISPAAIDLAGVVVVPQPDHFARVTAEDLEKIFAEVGLRDDQMNEWLERINNDGTVPALTPT
ncbi:MAG TPA: DUF4922 domain-containing protein [Blastocatellia bacterium]|nr:DUF4922 domain-containing protein [Blastocatellia bacterium]HMZ18828.1 DUF4922 domain-containing protein [Blastocatellia bacterium]HNG29870.1 DUF4922 domain-containing protein [Blastocatellia bacterium]